jgi:cyclophilin family peptidyl-prolyl cis-trans isomerase
MKLLFSVLGSIAIVLSPVCFAENRLEHLEKEMGSISIVVMETNLGTVEIALFEEKSPITVANFLAYVDDGFYNGTIFHRVIKDFVIQGGGFTPEFSLKKTKERIKNEAKNGLTNKRGRIAMARTGIIDSATSQFFINLKDNAMLDHKNETVSGYGYAVFGEVIEGMDTIDLIGSVATGEKFMDPENKRGLYYDVPLETVVIKSIQRK